MAELTLDDVSKLFPNGVEALARTSLAIADGEFVVLVGPSGSGKTTLLRIIAGLEQASNGRVVLGGKDVTREPPEARDIAMVFQNYALYSNMSVRANLGFGLRMRKTPKAEIKRRVDEVARMLQLEQLLSRKPGALSGGQRQRVAMGRAIVREPQLFLMDEPLSNLDAQLRVHMRAELALLHERLGVTTVYVTHDQIEATTLGQRVVVLNDGIVQQCDTPRRLFDRPANMFVASFIGSPAMNLVEARLTEGRATFGDISVPLAPRTAAALPDGFVLGFRPTDVQLGGDRAGTFEARIDVTEDLGADRLVMFAVDRAVVRGAAAGEPTPGAGGDEELLVAGQAPRLAARVSGRAQVRPGDRLRLAVDEAHLHFFDLQTGDAIPIDRDAVATEMAAAGLRQESLHAD